MSKQVQRVLLGADVSAPHCTAEGGAGHSSLPVQAGPRRRPASTLLAACVIALSRRGSMIHCVAATELDLASLPSNRCQPWAKTSPVHAYPVGDAYIQVPPRLVRGAARPLPVGLQSLTAYSESGTAFRVRLCIGRADTNSCILICFPGSLSIITCRWHRNSKCALMREPLPVRAAKGIPHAIDCIMSSTGRERRGGRRLEHQHRSWAALA